MSSEPRPAAVRRLILVCGREGAGKTTILRALAPRTPLSARIDGEDLGQVSPCGYDEPFWRLLRSNVAALTRNYWGAGYANVIAGSFFRTREDLLRFLALVPEAEKVHLIELLVSPEERLRRRLTRAKQTTQEWRDRVDAADLPGPGLGQLPAPYSYFPLDTTHLTPSATFSAITALLPAVYG